MSIVLLPLVILAAAQEKSASAAPAPEIGVNMHPLQPDYAVYRPARTLGVAAQLGISLVRIDIEWGWIESVGPGRSTWDPSQVRWLDTFLAEAAKRHMKVVATVLDTPCWASTLPGKRCLPAPPHYCNRYPPRNPRTYARFLQRLITHVGQKIQYYEIWNEPNLPGFWAHPDPVAYTRLLRAAYRAIKARDPAAQVLAGATSGADLSFIKGMYAAGAKGYFDTLSIHPYTGDRSPEDRSVPARSLRFQVERAHALMLRHGDTRPIWLTEFGQEVSAQITPAEQARYVTQALSLIRRWSYVQGAIWYELYDDPTGHDGQHFGLFRGTLSPRSAVRAFNASVLHG